MRINRKIWLIVISLFLALIIRFSIAPFSGCYDLTQFKNWSKQITIQGIHNAYPSISKDEQYKYPYPVLYPPVSLYFFKISGLIYKFFSPTFVIENHLFTFLMKLPLILLDIITSIIIFLFVRGKVGFKTAYWVMISYAFNPAIIFASSYWGQPDAIHSLCILLSLISITKNKSKLSWMFITIGIFTKPQVWIFVPVILLLTFIRFGIKRVIEGIFIGVITALVINFPFIWTNKLHKVVYIFIQIAHCMPFISCGAHNLWWLLTFGRAYPVSENELFLGLISYKIAGSLLMIIFFSYTLLRLCKNYSYTSIFLFSSFVAYIFFMFLTRIHSNHMYMVLPLLSMVWFLDKRLKWIYFTLSVTIFANMSLHDGVIVNWLNTISLGFIVNPSKIINSLINTCVLGYWIYILFTTKWKKDEEHIINIKAYILPLGSLGVILCSGVIAVLTIWKDFFISFGHNLVEEAYYTGWKKTLPCEHYLRIFDSMYNQLIYGLIGLSLFLTIGLLGYYLYIKKRKVSI
ncbi:MAG: hypothetical protein AB1414_09240 [bacterium]